MNVGDVQCDHPGCKARITLVCPWVGESPDVAEVQRLNNVAAEAIGWEVTPTDTPNMDFKPLAVDGFTLHSTDVAKVSTLCPEHRP